MGDYTEDYLYYSFLARGLVRVEYLPSLMPDADVSEIRCQTVIYVNILDYDVTMGEAMKEIMDCFDALRAEAMEKHVTPACVISLSLMAAKNGSDEDFENNDIWGSPFVDLHRLTDYLDRHAKPWKRDRHDYQ